MSHTYFQSTLQASSRSPASPLLPAAPPCSSLGWQARAFGPMANPRKAAGPLERVMTDASDPVKTCGATTLRMAPWDSERELALLCENSQGPRFPSASFRSVRITLNSEFSNSRSLTILHASVPLILILVLGSKGRSCISTC